MTPVDPITVSVVEHRLVGIVEEMGEAMLRTSYSQILNSSRDFSLALTAGDGRLIAQAEHIPVHVGALPWAVRALVEAFGDDVHEGDVFLLNDPYHGGSHLPDVTAFVPVMGPDGPAFWSVNRAHHSDIGGATHGGYNAAATEIWQEGLRLPPIRLYDRGALREDVHALLCANVRHPRDFQGDLAAQIGSARLGARRLEALLAELGRDVVEAAKEAVLDAAERQTRAVIGTWTDGVYEGRAVMDDDGRGREDIVIRARVTVAGDALTVDLSESDPQVESFLNSSYANMRSSVAMAVAFLLDPDIPKNEGTLRPVTVIARQGTVVWANPGAPVAMSTSHCAQDIVEAVVDALAPACPDRVMAGWGRRLRIAVKGEDPVRGRPFIWHMFHARPGGGASGDGDGWHGAGEWHTVGGLKFGSIEIAESRFPLFFEHHEFRANSGGEGRFAGGAGSDLWLHLETDTEARVNTAGEGARHGAIGRLGGGDGEAHRYRMHGGGGRPRVLGNKEEGVPAPPRAVFEIHAGGGGGGGGADARDPDARRRDRRDGFVTRRRRRR